MGTINGETCGSCKWWMPKARPWIWVRGPEVGDCADGQRHQPPWRDDPICRAERERRSQAEKCDYGPKEWTDE